MHLQISDEDCTIAVAPQTQVLSQKSQENGVIMTIEDGCKSSDTEKQALSQKVRQRFANLLIVYLVVCYTRFIGKQLSQCGKCDGCLKTDCGRFILL